MRDANRGAELERVLATHAAALGRLAASYETRPDELAARMQAADRLQRAVRELPLALRQAIVLAFEGLSNEEVAAVLGLTAGNVGVRLHRGKALLKATLGETT